MSSPRPETGRTPVLVGLGIVVAEPQMLGYNPGVGNRVLMTRRRGESVYGGWWEFPGGKVEPGESVDACVARELEEEIGVRVEVLGPLPGFGRVVHEYEHALVHLEPRVCRLLPDSPRPADLLVAEHKWCSAEDLGALHILPANGGIVLAVAAMLANSLSQ